jgi:hypothetical protein
MNIKIISSAAALAAGLVVPAAGTASAVTVAGQTAQAVTAPFSWQGHTWCPDLRGTYGSPPGCDEIQRAFVNPADAEFNPAQVSMNGSGYVELAMNSAGTESGAFTTGGEETFSASPGGNSIYSEISLPCTSSQIDNWPAFWLVTTGSWPAGGEIDALEGLHGKPRFNYHYLDKSGVSQTLSGAWTDTNGCGAHYYRINWYSGSDPRIDFYAGSTRVGTFAGSCTGLPSPCTATDDGTPIATGPMYAIFDYENDNGTESGPLVNGVSMEVQSFHGTHN